jgi:surface antigen
MTPERAAALDLVSSGLVQGENDMKPNVLIAGCLALFILCTCAVAGVQAAESYAEPDAVLGEWSDPEVTPTAAVNLTVAEETESAAESYAEPDAVLDECDDPEVTQTVAVDPTVAEEIESSTLMGECTTASNQAVYEDSPGPEDSHEIDADEYTSFTIPEEALKLSAAASEKDEGDVIGTYRGVPAYSNGANTTTGEGKYQCVEYVKRFYKDAMGVKHKWTGNAITYYDNAAEKGLIRYPNGSSVAPKPDDILVFDVLNDAWGHVAIITEVGDDYVNIIEQNVRRNNAYAKLTLKRDELGNYYIESGRKRPVKGWCRTEAVKTRDTVLVLDASGSMRGTPVTVLKEAAKVFCSEVLDTNEGWENRIAIVVYSSDVEETLDFTSDLNSLNNTIDLIWAGGGTNISGAVDSASLLLSFSDADTKNIILMTDGLPEHGEWMESGRYSSADSKWYGNANYVYDQCSELKQRYNIYTLGFFHGLSGSNLKFGQRFLEDIQNKGHYVVTDASKLKFIFEDLVEDITKQDYPVIIVHGMMGGKLYDSTGDLVWFKLSGDLGRLNIEENLKTPENGINLNAPGIEREYGVGVYEGKPVKIKLFYKKLVDSLCEQFPDRAVYFYSYDWRKSNNDSAAGLNDLINYVKKQTNYSKVDLVCHSMGGLVASSYVENYTASDVRYIITLATPYEGSPEIIGRTLDERALGTYGFFTRGFGWQFSKRGLTKEIMVGLPSSAEIVPTERYFKSTKFLKTGTGEVELDPDPPTGIIGGIGVTPKGKDITYEEYCDNMSSMFGNNYNSAVAFQNSIKDALLDLDSTYFAVATGESTIEEIIINDGTSLETLEVLKLTYNNTGDGTVPYMSATMNGALPTKYKDVKDSSGNSRYREFKASHTGILSHKKALQWVKDILNQTSNPYEESDKINYPGYTVIRIACPIDVTIEVNGEILSSDPETGSIYVPNGRLDFIGDNGVSICLEDTGTVYDITIVGTGEGTMDYDISWYDADNTLNKTRSIYAVPITADTKITTTTDNTGSTVLNIDSDGDGTFDTQWSVDASGELVVADLKPAYTSYSDGGSDTTSFAITSGSVSFWRSAGITGINFPDGVKGMVILNDPSPEITPPENTYAIFDISAPSFEGSAEINFVIPSAILAGSGYTKTDVMMKHYTNDTWQNLPTYFIGEELGAVSYMATTTNFTPFAIVYETGGATVAGTGGSQKASASDETAMTPTVDETQPVGEETAATGEEPTVSPSEGTTAETEATATKSPAPLVGMLIGLGAAVLLRRRT